MLLFGILFCGNTFATDSSITISLSGAVNLNLIGGNSDGAFGKSTSATANVETNNYTGYTFTVTGGNATGALVGENSSSHIIPSIDTPLTEVAFDTSAHNNQWGFLPSHLYDSSTGTSLNDKYQPSPTNISSTTIDVTKSANAGDPNEYTLALAARVDDQTANDHYSGTFTLAATGNATEYHIAYVDANNNMPGITYGTSNSGTAQISGVTPTKDGYIFGGWCTVSVVIGQDCVSSGGTVIPVNGNYALDSSSANNANLYAIWTRGYETFVDAFVGAGKTDSDKVNGYFKMQDITPSICNSIITGSPATTADIAKNTLIDTRNNKTYLVAKYADSHCWMRENLNLPMTAGVGITAYNFATGSTFTYTPEQYGTTQTTTGTAWEQDAHDGARSYGGDKDKYIGGTDITTYPASITSSGQPYERIGIYYNWAAATAQTGAQAAAAGTSGTTTVTTSICPKGWRLPANDSDYSFSVLMGNYGLPTTNQPNGYSGALQNPLNFNRSGYYYMSGNMGAVGIGGYSWSFAARSSTEASCLDFYNGGFSPQRSNRKGFGIPIRCVAV